MSITMPSPLATRTRDPLEIFFVGPGVLFAESSIIGVWRFFLRTEEDVREETLGDLPKDLNLLM